LITPVVVEVTRGGGRWSAGSRRPPFSYIGRQTADFLPHGDDRFSSAAAGRECECSGSRLRSVIRALDETRPSQRRRICGGCLAWAGRFALVRDHDDRCPESWQLLEEAHDLFAPWPSRGLSRQLHRRGSIDGSFTRRALRSPRAAASSTLHLIRSGSLMAVLQQKTPSASRPSPRARVAGSLRAPSPRRRSGAARRFATVVRARHAV